MGTSLKRTQEEILARIEQVADEDFFGFAREVLISALDFEYAKPFLQDGATQDGWRWLDSHEAVERDARGYLDFAIGKILNHRGLSAGRSVSKLTEYAWLLGRDNVVKAMDEADYPQYGAPKVKAFAEGMGWAFRSDEMGPSDDIELERMAQGQPCQPDCISGCS